MDLKDARLTPLLKLILVRLELRIVEADDQSEYGMTVQELAEDLDERESTINQYLSRLKRYGYIIKYKSNGNKLFRLKLNKVGKHVKEKAKQEKGH